MRLEGTYRFENAPRTLVWEMFMDPEVLAKTMPGCERLELAGENQFEGDLHIRVGPVQGKFKGTVKLEDLVAPASYAMQVEGRGPAGFVNGSGTVRLEEEDGSTVMHYAGDAQVGGRIASVGQRLMDSSARSITKQSLEALDSQVQARLQPTAPAAADDAVRETVASNAPPAAPSQTAFALNVARDVANDFLADDQQRWVVLGAGSLAVLLLLRAVVRQMTRSVARQVVQMMREEEV